MTTPEITVAAVSCAQAPEGPEDQDEGQLATNPGIFAAIDTKLYKLFL